MRIQPIDAIGFGDDVVAKPPVLKSRLKRLFDRPLNSVLRISSAEKQPPSGGTAPEFEPSSVCLDKMVQNFIEDDNEKQSAAAAAVKCGRHRCNCFNGNSNDSSDDEFGFFSESLTVNSSLSDPSDTLKVLPNFPNFFPEDIYIYNIFFFLFFSVQLFYNFPLFLFGCRV